VSEQANARGSHGGATREGDRDTFVSQESPHSSTSRRLRAATDGEPWRVEIGDGPFVGLAVHAGHDMRPPLLGALAIDEATRLREEDPHTELIAALCGTHIETFRSRFEVDLNRPPEEAICVEPADCWNLQIWKQKDGLTQTMYRRSLDEHTRFYQMLGGVLDRMAERSGRFLVLDCHSYNHRRDGPSGPAADPAMNPEINIGTGSMDRSRWAPVVERFNAALAGADFLGRHLDVRENVKFRGRYLAEFVHRRYPESGCCLAIEVKKFFMDEWTGAGSAAPSMRSVRAAAADGALSGVLARLRDGEILRQELPGDLGEIHIDHLQPVICVYREPSDGSDPGTRRLLSGLASVIVAAAEPTHLPQLREAVSRLTELMIESFGAAFVLEIWSGPCAAKDAAGGPPTFRIVAEKQGVSGVTLKALERALLAIEPDRPPRILVEYRSRAAPDGLDPVLAESEESRDTVFLVGLEVPPVYRDPQSGQLIPDALRRFTRQLGHALRQAFYAFAEAHAVTRPAHFHELGPRALTDGVARVDAGLATVGDAFDLLLHATPVNAERAYAAFVETACDSVPEFLYRPLTVDHGALKLSLYKIPLESIEDPALHHIFDAQRDELDRQITMLADRNTPRFLLGSQQVFGAPDPRLRDVARQLLDAQPQRADRSGKSVVTAPEFARMAERELKYYRATWPDLPARVELREDIPGVMVSKGNFLIGTNATVREDRVAPLLHHEIGTHVLTYYNGLKQPLSQFHTGMPGYEETQEGLAVLSEYLCGGLGLPRLRTLAGRVVAVDAMIGGADFVETYRMLARDFGFGAREGFTIAMRVYRGGGLTKDIVYLRGLMGLLDHLAAGHAFEDMLLGKVTLDHMDVVEELRWRRILSPGPLKPRYLNDPDAQRRLATLPSGDGLAELLRMEAS
jgi:uncharacterized protein (TIGR02421 family)